MNYCSSNFPSIKQNSAKTKWVTIGDDKLEGINTTSIAQNLPLIQEAEKCFYRLMELESLKEGAFEGKVAILGNRRRCFAVEDTSSDNWPLFDKGKERRS